MDKETLHLLEMALEASPDNLLLRTQVAKGFFDLGDFENAKKHYALLDQAQPSYESKKQLARCYSKLANYGAGIVICELLLADKATPEVVSLYIQLLIDNKQKSEAVQQYQNYLNILPGWRDSDLETQLSVKVQQNQSFEDDDFEDNDDEEFLEKPNLNFSGVGGMNHLKEEIRIKIIQPLQNPDLFKAFGKKAGGGILMYGPPGCGKTYLAKATAGEIQSKFLNVGINEIVDMWLGNSEKNLNEKFEIARRNNPCVLFFDEIDALGSKRNDLKQSSGRNVINQFLKELDGVDSDNEGVLILGATNSPWHMDSAFLRPGRFDRIIFVPPPDTEARAEILELHLKEKPIETLDYQKIAQKTEGFSGADLKALIDVTIEEKLRQSMKTGKIEKITNKDLLQAVAKIRPSTKEWFNIARNYALYSNASGLYDDVLAYLKL